MDAKSVWEVVKEGLPFGSVKGVEDKSEWNRMLYAVSQKVWDGARAWCQAQVKEHTGFEGIIKRLEPMGAEERRRELMLLADSAIDGGDVEALKKLLDLVDKIYGLGGDSRPVIQMVDFSEAYDDTAAA